MTRNRYFLYLAEIGTFADWAHLKGWIREESCGDYEVLRLRKGRKVALCYNRTGCKHCTVYGESAKLVNRWLRERGRHAASMEF